MTAHLSTRFIGYAEANRQTVSFKLRSEKPRTRSMWRLATRRRASRRCGGARVRSLGRPPTDADMAAYISRRQGARSMGHVRGDTFALSTWRKHTIRPSRAVV